MKLTSVAPLFGTRDEKLGFCLQLASTSLNNGQLCSAYMKAKNECTKISCVVEIQFFAERTTVDFDS